MSLKRIQSIAMAKTLFFFNTQKGIKEEKNDNIDDKALYKLMINAAQGKAMENLRNRIDIKLALFKMDMKTKLNVT